MSEFYEFHLNLGLVFCSRLHCQITEKEQKYWDLLVSEILNNLTCTVPKRFKAKAFGYVKVTLLCSAKT